MSVVFGPGILEELVRHAQASLPQEGCGLIVGNQGVMTRFIPMKNVLASVSAYEMDSGELISMLKSLRESGEELLAIYHSHPSGPAGPSTRDIVRAYYPEVAHVIVSLADPEHPAVRGYRIAGGVALELEVRAIV